MQQSVYPSRVPAPLPVRRVFGDAETNSLASHKCAEHALVRCSALIGPKSESSGPFSLSSNYPCLRFLMSVRGKVLSTPSKRSLMTSPSAPIFASLPTHHNAIPPMIDSVKGILEIGRAHV